MYPLVVNSLKTTPVVRRVLPCVLYHTRNSALMPQVHSTSKVDDFYINSSYPDDSETPPAMKQRWTSVHATPQWNEAAATQSEADVKADRGEAASMDDIFQPEADLEPKIDEM
ncbi:hypothetical protein BJX63DRAFT_734 [Aspergillus granulosus]|uniref:Uncharacterized protein n=1 Tax=Aspergillus granulosus TaxID=176169 RepID=A0ABR4I537_9EURO